MAFPEGPQRVGAQRQRIRNGLIVITLLAAMLVGGRSSSAEVPAGVPQGVSLTPSGTVRLKEPGMVFDARDVQGMIYVDASNVTISRTRVTYGGWYAIRIASGVTGTVVTDSDVVCTDKAKGRGIVFGGYTATRVHVQGCADPFRFSDSNPAVITDSYVDAAPWGTQTGSTPTTTTPPTTTTTTTAPAPPPATSADQLMMSSSTDRSGAAPLAGATVVGSRAIFLSTATASDTINRVEWFIDGVLYRDDDLYAPYDLVPNAGSASGLLDTTKLTNGTHKVDAKLVLTSGSTQSVTAQFTVDNGTQTSPTTSPTTAPGPTSPSPTPPGMPPKQSIIDGAGLSNPSALRPSGSIKISTAGAVVENLDISGSILIDAPDVTVRNVRVTGSSSSVLVRATERGARSRIEHCEIKVTDQSRGGIGGYSEGMVVRHCDISGYSDGIKAERGALYEYNYIHPSRPAGSTYHLDGIQGSSDSDWTARYNVIDVPISVGGNAAILSSAHNGTTNYYIKNVVVEYNYLRGGNYVVYLTCGKNTADNCAFVDNYQLRGNVFATDGYRYGYTRIESCAKTTVEGNILSDGTPLNRC